MSKEEINNKIIETINKIIDNIIKKDYDSLSGLGGALSTLKETYQKEYDNEFLSTYNDLKINLNLEIATLKLKDRKDRVE